MLSSFKKLSRENYDSLPTRKVHVLSPGKPQYNPRTILKSLEERLSNLEHDFRKAYQSKLEQGRAAGYQQGYEDGRNEAAGLVEIANRELQALRQEKVVFARKYKQEIVDMIVVICTKLLLAQIVKPEVVIPIVEDTLESLNPPLEATIYCHPEKIHNLRLAKEKFTTVTRGSVDIVANPLLSETVIRVESDNTVIDIDLIKELEAIALELEVELEP